MILGKDLQRAQLQIEVLLPSTANTNKPLILVGAPVHRLQKEPTRKRIKNIFRCKATTRRVNALDARILGVGAKAEQLGKWRPAPLPSLASSCEIEISPSKTQIRIRKSMK